MIRCIAPMKINKIPDGKEAMFPSLCKSGNYFAQLKKDGYWYQFENSDEGALLFSRNVSVTTGMLTEKGANVPHIMDALKCLPIDTVLIGEIYYPGKRSKDVTPVMGALPEKAIERQNGEYGLLHYYLHDMIVYDGKDLMQLGASVRYELLKRVYEKFNLGQYDFMELAVRVDDEIEKACTDALMSGEEGMVLKKKTAPYTPGKRPAWDTIKIKKTDTCDAVIMGTETATIFYDGKLDLGVNYCGPEAASWPYWAIFRTDLSTGQRNFDKMVPLGDRWVIKGIEFGTYPVTKAFYHGWPTAIRIGAYDGDNLVSIGTVSSGLSDNDKANLPSYVGKVCELAGMEKDPEAHTLRHFHFIGLRPDKDPIECSLKSIFG